MGPNRGPAVRLGKPCSLRSFVHHHLTSTGCGFGHAPDPQQRVVFRVPERHRHDQRLDAFERQVFSIPLPGWKETPRAFGGGPSKSMSKGPSL